MEQIPTKRCEMCKKFFEKKIDCSSYNWELRRFCSKSCSGRLVTRGTTSNTGRTHIKKKQRLSPKTEFKKGTPPWNKGKKFPQFSGLNSTNWKGGVYPEHLKVRHSPEMKFWRTEVFKRDNYTCVLCGRKRKVGDRVVLHADHIKPFAKYPKLRLSLKNGRTLCRECHLKTDTHGVNLK